MKFEPKYSQHPQLSQSNVITTICTAETPYFDDHQKFIKYYQQNYENKKFNLKKIYE